MEGVTAIHFIQIPLIVTLKKLINPILMRIVWFLKSCENYCDHLFLNAENSLTKYFSRWSSFCFSPKGFQPHHVAFQQCQEPASVLSWWANTDESVDDETSSWWACLSTDLPLQQLGIRTIMWQGWKLQESQVSNPWVMQPTFWDSYSQISTLLIIFLFEKSLTVIWLSNETVVWEFLQPQSFFDSWINQLYPHFLFISSQRSLGLEPVSGSISAVWSLQDLHKNDQGRQHTVILFSKPTGVELQSKYVDVPNYANPSKFKGG